MDKVWSSYLKDIRLLAIAVAGVVFAVSPLIAGGTGQQAEENNLVPVRVSSGPLIVVELFTSQGCSSCPPADSMLTALADRPGVLALSWAIDYWNRLGWIDSFSHPLHSKRQRAYNRRLGRSNIYTPQLFVNGTSEMVGSRRRDVNQALSQTLPTADKMLTPRLALEDETIRIGLPQTDMTGMAAIHLVWFLSSADIAISSGENQGRTLHYTNVVRHTRWIDDWRGKETTLAVPLNTLAEQRADGLAVLIQSDYGDGPIVGAAYMLFTTATETGR